VGARVLSVESHLAHVYAGKAEILAVESEVLKGNPLGDPHVREWIAYSPPGLDSQTPLHMVLPAFTSRPHGALETHPWRRGWVAELDERLRQGLQPPCALVLPDAFTKLGGSQYVNSTATGSYEDYSIQEVVPLAQEHFGRPVHTVLGKSSGGFGALHLAMHHPGTFQGAASISGDCGFDALFPGEFLGCLRGLLEWESPRAFLEAFHSRPDLSGDGHALINTLAMAACYSPNPRSELGFDLPFDLETGELVDEVWQRWLAFDPLVACVPHAEALRGLERLHIECGRRDEFHLQWGARRLVRKLRELGVDCTHEEHEGGHRGIDDRVIGFLASGRS